MVPPGIKPNWDDNVPWQQLMLLTYHNIRTVEEAEHEIAMVKARMPVL